MLKKYFFRKLFIVLMTVFMGSDLYAKDLDVKLKTSFDQKYDDNITYAESDKKTDFITTLSVGMDVSYESKKMLTELSADVVQQLFWKYTKDDDTSQHVRINVSRQLSKSDNIIVSDTFSHTFDPLNFAEEFAREGDRNSYFRNKFDFIYLKNFTEHLSIRVGYGNDLDTTSRSDRIDSYVNRVSLEGIYVFSSKSIFFGKYDFLNRKLEPGGSASINTISGGVRQYFTEKLSFDGRIGVDIIDSYNGKMYVMPLWIGTITDQITEKTSANLSFTQRYSTNPYTDDVFNSKRLSVGIDSQLRKKLSGSVAAFYGRGEYVSLGIEDNLFGGNVALRYNIYKNLKGNLSYTYSRKTSNFVERKYKKNVVRLGVSTEF